MNHTVQRHPLAEANPLRSLPLHTPASRALGMTDLAKARWLMAQAEIALPLARANLIGAHAELGHANRVHNAERRRRHQASAMRLINRNRAALLAAHNTLDAARAEVARLEQDPASDVRAPVVSLTTKLDPAFNLPRTLHVATADHPAGSTGRIEQSKVWGWHAVVKRPVGMGGVVASFPTEAEARAWLDAEFSPAAVH